MGYLAISTNARRYQTHHRWQLSEKMLFSSYPILTGSAEARVIWGGIVTRLLIAYFIGNISVKNYQNPFTCVIAKPKVGRLLRHGVECLAVTLPRRETSWNLQGCLKLANTSHPPLGRSSLYCDDTWGRHCCLISFFSDFRYCLNCEDIARQICAMVPCRWRFFGDFLGHAFPASRAQHISDLHSKFALGPHHA